jgi:hypothetical protein
MLCVCLCGMPRACCRIVGFHWVDGVGHARVLDALTVHPSGDGPFSHMTVLTGPGRRACSRAARRTPRLPPPPTKHRTHLPSAALASVGCAPRPARVREGHAPAIALRARPRGLWVPRCAALPAGPVLPLAVAPRTVLGCAVASDADMDDDGGCVGTPALTAPSVGTPRAHVCSPGMTPLPHPPRLATARESSCMRCRMALAACSLRAAGAVAVDARLSGGVPAHPRTQDRAPACLWPPSPPPRRFAACTWCSLLGTCLEFCARGGK